MPFAAILMHLEITILSEVSQTEKDKQQKMSLICGILKNGADELVYRTETDSQTQRAGLWLPRQKGGERDELGGWDWHMNASLVAQRLKRLPSMQETWV